MKNWFSNTTDPFLALGTKLTDNKDMFLKFLRNQYDIPELTLDYKRSANTVKYPELNEET